MDGPIADAEEQGVRAIVERLALAAGSGAAAAAALAGVLLGVGPLEQALRSVASGLAVYGLVRASGSVVGRMILYRMVSARRTAQAGGSCRTGEREAMRPESTRPGTRERPERSAA